MKNKLQFLESKYEAILSNQEGNDEVSYYTGAILLLGGVLVITLLGIFIKNNYSIRLLVFIAILLISMIVYKSKIKGSARNLDTKRASAIEDTPESNLKAKLNQLSQSLRARSARISGVKWFYISNFPIFLFSVKEFISGPMSTSYMIWSLVITFFMGLVIWKLYFRVDLMKIEEEQLSVSQMIRDLD